MKNNTSSIGKRKNQTSASSKLNVSVSQISKQVKSPQSNQSFYQQILNKKQLKPHLKNHNLPDKENTKQIPQLFVPIKCLPPTVNPAVLPMYTNEKIKIQTLIDKRKLEKSSPPRCSQYEIIPTNHLPCYENFPSNDIFTHPNTLYKKGSKQLQDSTFSTNSVNNYYTNISTSEINDVRSNQLQDVTNMYVDNMEIKSSIGIRSDLHQCKYNEEHNNYHQIVINPLNIGYSPGSSNSISLQKIEENQTASRNNSSFQQKSSHQRNFSPSYGQYNQCISSDNKLKFINNNQEKSDKNFNQTLIDKDFKKAYQVKQTSLNLNDIMDYENHINNRLQSHQKYRDYELEQSLYGSYTGQINKNIFPELLEIGYENVKRIENENNKELKGQNFNNSFHLQKFNFEEFDAKKINFEEFDVKKSKIFQNKYFNGKNSIDDNIKYEPIILNENETKLKRRINNSSEILASTVDLLKKNEIKDISLSNTEKSVQSLSIEHSQNSEFQKSISEMETIREDMLEKNFEDMILKLKYNIQKLLIKTELNQKEIMQLQEIQEKEKILLGNYQQTHNVLLVEVCNVNKFTLFFPL